MATYIKSLSGNGKTKGALLRLYAYDVEWADIDLSDTILPSPVLDCARLSSCKFDYCCISGGSYRGMRCDNVSATRSIVRNCYIESARFIGTDFTESSIRETIFNGCNFVGVVFNRADLDHTHFIACSFVGCLFLDVEGCNTETFNENCSLSVCSGIPNIPMVCPETGGFVAYKKVRGFTHIDGAEMHAEAIVKLYIPDEAKRSSGLGRKCRCNFAKVLAINWADPRPMPVEYARSRYVSQLVATTYTEGKAVYADKWDEDRWAECSHGIHFFMTEREALAY